MQTGVVERAARAKFSLMWAFLKSVLLGAISATVPLLIITIILGGVLLAEGFASGDVRIFPALWLAFLPLFIAIPLVFSASLIFGIPLTLILKRQGRESAAAYIGIGAAIGAIIPIVILLAMAAPAGYWMSVLGALGGGVTGRTWWIAARCPNVS